MYSKFILVFLIVVLVSLVLFLGGYLISSKDWQKGDRYLCPKDKLVPKNLKHNQPLSLAKYRKTGQ